ncbi:MAG: hypothetical protein LC781_06085 [Actinobacteria bacterium]|nr:hypothetical protein [Actinomycetota bacterium]
MLLITSRSASERGLQHDIGKLGVSDRILAVADIFDALSRDRPTAPPYPWRRYSPYLNKESGEKLCPRCVGTLDGLVSKGDL